MKIQWGIRIPMRDGGCLAADLFLPDLPAAPVILVRTPYGRQQNELIEQARFFTSYGYVVLNVDVRGRGDSDGIFVPYRNEGIDGFDTVEWAGTQEWSTGCVGTLGGSYLGKVQWLTALEKPPHLKAMIPLVSPSDPFVELPTGTVVPSHLCWLFLTSGRMVQNTHAVDWDTVYWHLPLVTMDEAAGRSIPMWKEEFLHTHLDDWWRSVCYQDRFNEIDLPVLHISGWYDDEQIGTSLNFVGMSKHAPSLHTRKAQRLIMGPWPHQVNRSSVLGNIDFTEGSIIDLRGIQLRFFDRWLKNSDNGIDQEAPVRLFVMGVNQWRDEQEWPLSRTVYTPFYFHKDGSLSTDKPKEGLKPSNYDYDPDNPVPFITEPTSEQIGGPDDYRLIHQRDDVLVFTSETLSKAIEVTGPVRVELFAETTAPDTDFTAQLHDVWPNGFTQRLCDGFVRVRFRMSMENPQFLKPNTMTKLVIDCWNTSHVFLPGHKICVHIASSAFPKYDRNLNTDEELGIGTKRVIAKQTIYHDGNLPSAIILPVIPK